MRTVLIGVAFALTYAGVIRPKHSCFPVVAKGIKVSESASEVTYRTKYFEGDESLSAINVRKEDAVSSPAIRRNGEVLVNHSGEIDLEHGDEVIVIGVPDEIKRLSLLFHHGENADNSPPM